MIDKIGELAQYAGQIGSILTVLCIIVKPIRRKVFGLKAVEEGQRCMLRSEMLSIYYKHREERILRQYEYENFMFLFDAYKALNGNSFILKIKEEVEKWEVVS